MNILNLSLVIISSYLIGTVPFSLIFSKILANKNPGKEGSGNYGAMNSYEVTGRKTIGLLVFICDVLKGALAVFIAYYLIYPKTFYALIATIFLVIGHNFNIFLKFKGGRGLAACLGALLVYNPFLPVIWCALWFLFYRIVRKDVLFANSWASVISPVLVICAPSHVIFFMNYNIFVTAYEYKVLSIILCMLVFAAHIRSHRSHQAGV